MPFELLALYLKLPVFALVAARLGGLLMFQPVLGALALPVHLRALLVLGLAALLTPAVRLPPDAPTNLAALTIALAGELLLGILLSLVSVACFLGLQLGGLLIAQEAGLAFGQILDPNSEEQESVTSMLYLQLAVVVYFIVGGHRALVSACLDTFHTIPLLDAAAATRPAVDLILQALAVSGQIALRVAAPTMLAMFLVNLALGFVSRTMPQFNVLTFGFSVKALAGFVLMAVSLPAAVQAFLFGLQELESGLAALFGG